MSYSRSNIFVITSLAVVLIVISSTVVQAAPKEEDDNPYGLEEGWLLAYAAGQNNISRVKYWIAKGADINWDKGKPLEMAIESNHLGMVKFLLQQGANPNGTTPEDLRKLQEDPELKLIGLIPEETLKRGKPLRKAAENNNIEAMKLLLDAGADTIYARFDTSALEKAVENGHLEAVKLLLKVGADVNVKNGEPLREAANKGNVEMVKVLIAAGAHLDAANGLGTPVTLAAEDGHLDVVKILVESGLNSSAIDAALLSAGSRGYFPVVKYLVEKGADVNIGNVLSSSSEYGHLEVVKLLLEKGSNKTCDEKHVCAWHLAAKNGHIDIITVFADYDYNISTPLASEILLSSYFGEIMNNDLTAEGWTVIHIVAARDHPIIEGLVDLGCNINAKDNAGNTALHIAVQFKKLIVAKELLRFCAETHHKNDEGKTVLDMAEDISQGETLQATYMTLVPAMKSLLPEKVASLPDTYESKIILNDEFMKIIEANATLKRDLGGIVRYSIYTSQAISYIFEERARLNMTSIIEDRRCRPSLQDFDTLPYGIRFLAECTCVPKKGSQITFVPIEETDLCPKSTMEGGMESGSLIPDHTTETTSHVTTTQTPVA